MSLSEGAAAARPPRPHTTPRQCTVADAMGLLDEALSGQGWLGTRFWSIKSILENHDTKTSIMREECPGCKDTMGAIALATAVAGGIVGFYANHLRRGNFTIWNLIQC